MPRRCSATAAASCIATAMPGLTPVAPDPNTGAVRLTEVACWAHARRKLYDVYEATASPLAKEALVATSPSCSRYEARIKGRAPPERLAVRQQDAIPLLAELEAFLRRR